PPHTGTSITIDAGGYVVDYASVTPSTATGSVAFRYYTDQSVCSNDSATNPTGGTSAGGGSVSSGSAHSSTLHPTSGIYYFRAFFTGTGLNNSSSSDCSETLTVNQFQPTLGTGQTVKITDSVTISVSGGGALDGTAHFQPFSDPDCSAANSLADQEN